MESQGKLCDPEADPEVQFVFGLLSLPDPSWIPQEL